MADLVVQAENRTEFGKNVSRRLRAQGLIPAVVYGGDFGTVHVSVDPAEIVRILSSESGRNTIFKLEVGDQLAEVLIRDLQIDPVKGTLVHADFQTVAMDVIREFQVRVEIQGTAVGVRTDEGILEVVMRDIDVECLPRDVPDSIAVDVTELEIGDAVRVSDLTVDSKTSVLSDSELVVVHVVPPRVEVEEEVEEELEEEEGVEPEVIKKGKAEEEGGEKSPPEAGPEE